MNITNIMSDHWQQYDNEMPMTHEQTISDIERDFFDPNVFHTGSEDELQALSEDSRLIHMWKWPHIPLTAEISRITTKIRWIEQRQLRITSDIAEQFVSQCLKDIPFAEPNVIVNYPGMLRMSTRCLICYGIFSQRGCRHASTIDHPNCDCKNPIYGQHCLTRALRNNIYPAVSSISFVIQKYSDYYKHF